MPTKGQTIRKRLFDLYSKQLELGGENPPADSFVCLLCYGMFTRDSLNGPRPNLSLAHIVPKALGGKLVTLACTECNNGNGAQLESELIEHFAYQDWSKGVGTRKARLSGDFGDIGVEFKRSPDNSNWAVYSVKGQTNPEHLIAFEQWTRKHSQAENPELTWKIQWSVRSRPAQVNAAIQQSAYLAMFAHFGYDFAARPQYEKLRHHLLNPKENSWLGRILDMVPSTVETILGKREFAVMFVREPEPCISVVLRFRPKIGEERTVGILLPPVFPADAPLPILEKGNLVGGVVPFVPERFRTRPHYFAELWRHIQSKKDGKDRASDAS